MNIYQFVNHLKHALQKKQFTYETPSVVSTGIPQFTYETPSVVSTGIPQNNHTTTEDSTPYGNLQPIADIIEDTLENDEDDYSEQIMVETFEFNGQTYWIDEENRVLDKDTFQHIGQYDDSTAAISFYANAI